MRSRKARPQVLEPIVDLAVTAPESHMGDITGGLASKRARINGTDSTRDGEILIKAQVPLSELRDYAAELKGSTGWPWPLRPGVQPLRAGAATGAEAVDRSLQTAAR